MCRKAQVLFQTGWIYEITTDIQRFEGKDKAPSFDDYRFGYYYEDRHGRFLYLYQPDSSLKGIRKDIESLKRNKKPSVNELFDEVEIVNERTGGVITILRNVDLVGILEAMKGVIRDYRDKGLKE